MLMNEAYGTFVKTQEESDSESISNCENSSSGSINNLTGTLIIIILALYPIGLYRVILLSLNPHFFKKCKCF